MSLPHGNKTANNDEPDDSEQSDRKKRRTDAGPAPVAHGMGGLVLIIHQRYRFVVFVYNEPEGDDEDGTVEFLDYTGQLTKIDGTSCNLVVAGNAAPFTVPVDNVISAVPQLTWPVLQPALAPITCRIIAAGQQVGLVAKAAAYGIDFNQLLSMVIELDLTTPTTPELHQDIVLASIPSLAPGGHTPSCYNAATILYNLLAANPLPSVANSQGNLVPASISGASDAAGFQGRVKPAGNDPQFTQNLTIACDGLCLALTTASGTGVGWVFGVHFGIHGFVIAITGDTAELLQSFAGEGGEMLMGFLEKTLTHGRNYTLAQLTSLLREMIVEGPEDSDPGALRAQSIFFGGRADDPGNGGLPVAPLRWVSCQMKAGAAIDQALIAWIQAGIVFYDEVKALIDSAE